MIIKKLAIVASLIMMATISFAQIPVEVTGLLKRKRVVPVKLFKVLEGKTVEIASITPTKTGQFGFLFYPEYEGLFVIGTGNALSGADNYKFYFKGGDKLAITINDTTYTLNGKLNTKENIVLAQWQNLTYNVERKSVNFMKVNSTFIDFFPQLEDVVAKSKTFLNGKATGNIKFDKQIKDIINLDLANYASIYLNSPRSAHPAIEELSDYYTTLKAQNLAKTTAKIYKYPWGLRTLHGVISVNMRQDGRAYKRGVEGVDIFTSYVPNDTLKGDVALDNAANYKTITDYMTLMAAYGKYVITPTQVKRDSEIMSPLLTYKPGTDAYGFSYPDKEGKTVSMASLKGKVVLVDVWATWCLPCRAEIPFLKKLEEDMKDKDVQIISLSTDAVVDKEKWLKMIKDEDLGGMQLFAGGPNNEFSKYYKINSIPRFLVFDKNGKIVTIDSPRPSQPELKALLEKELAK